MKIQSEEMAFNPEHSKPKRRPQFHESRIQTSCVTWFRIQYPAFSKVFFAVPNGGSRNAREAGYLKGEGVTSGVSDLILLVPRQNFHGLCIEMKSGKNNLTDSQIEFKTQVTDQGFKYVLCRSLEEFVNEVSSYIGFTLPNQSNRRGFPHLPFPEALPRK